MDRRIEGLLLGGALGVVLVVFLVGQAIRSGAVPFSDLLPVVPPAAGVDEPAGPVPSLSPPMAVADVYARFAELGRGRSAGEPVDLALVRAGDLVLPSGRVVVGDAFLFERSALDRSLPAGRHPVLLLRAEWPTRHTAITAALVRAAPGDPVTWEPAIVEGQDVRSPGPGESFGYAVDSGTAVFASLEAVERVDAAGEAGFTAYSEAVGHALFPGEDEFHDWADVPIDGAAGTNVVAFASGYGDGAYPAWFGLDATGRPLVLLTSFEILDAE